MVTDNGNAMGSSSRNLFDTQIVQQTNSLLHHKKTVKTGRIRINIKLGTGFNIVFSFNFFGLVDSPSRPSLPSPQENTDRSSAEAPPVETSATAREWAEPALTCNGMISNAAESSFRNTGSYASLCGCQHRKTCQSVCASINWSHAHLVVPNPH
jgi:hypothetical protein